MQLSFIVTHLIKFKLSERRRSFFFFKAKRIKWNQTAFTDTVFLLRDALIDRQSVVVRRHSFPLMRLIPAAWKTVRWAVSHVSILGSFQITHLVFGGLLAKTHHDNQMWETALGHHEGTRLLSDTFFKHILWLRQLEEKILIREITALSVCLSWMSLLKVVDCTKQHTTILEVTCGLILFVW